MRIPSPVIRNSVVMELVIMMKHAKLAQKTAGNVCLPVGMEHVMETKTALPVM